MHPSIFQYGVNSYITPEQSSSLTNVIFNIHTRLQGAPNQFMGDDYNQKTADADLSEIVQTPNNSKKTIGPVYVFPLNKTEYDPENKRIQRVANAYTQTCKVWSFQSTDEQLSLGEIIQTEKIKQLGSIKVMPDLLLPISIVHEAKDYSNLQSINKNLPFSLFKNSDDKSSDNTSVARYDNTITAMAWNLVPYIPLLDEKHKAVLPTTLSGVVVGRPNWIGPGSEDAPPSTDLAAGSLEEISHALGFRQPLTRF